MSQKSISACSFYEPQGRVIMATTHIFNYNLEIDKDVKIKQDQLNAVARDYLRTFLRQLTASGYVNPNLPDEQRTLVNGMLSEEAFIADAYKDSSLKDRLPGGKEFN